MFILKTYFLISAEFKCYCFGDYFQLKVCNDGDCVENHLVSCGDSSGVIVNPSSIVLLRYKGASGEIEEHTGRKTVLIRITCP